MQTRQQLRFTVLKELCKERLKTLHPALDREECGGLHYAIEHAKNIQDVKNRWVQGFRADGFLELFNSLVSVTEHLVKTDPFSDKTPHFATFQLCCHHLEDMDKSDMDYEAMQQVTQCSSLQQVYDNVVIPYNEMYFRELIQTLDDAAADLTKARLGADVRKWTTPIVANLKVHENCGIKED